MESKWFNFNLRMIYLWNIKHKQLQLSEKLISIHVAERLSKLVIGEYFVDIHISMPPL